MHSHNEDELDSIAGSERKALSITLLLILISCIVEMIGGYASNSLSLFSDAIHLLSDVGSITLALALSIMVQYGISKDSELYGALVNGMTLFVVAVWIGYESVSRIGNPTEIHSVVMVVIAGCCGIVDYIAIQLLRSYRHNQGIEAVYQHLSSDLLSSLGIVIGAIAVYHTGYNMIDSIVGCIIAIVILVNSTRLISSTIEKLRK